ncbi:MAG: ribonuclease III [Clostridia bacterium]|nr:ribonuclease III [Clostridia bacterium]
MEAGVTFRRGDYSPLVLAYMGDAYFETLAREYLVGDGNCKPSLLNDRAKEIVTAHNQSAMVDRLLPLLTDEELAIYKSGRNSKSAHRSKSASAVEYRRATGLECLYGYFWLSAQYDRARELFLRGVE